MNKITIEEIVKATEGRLIFGRKAERVSGVSTDSRTVAEGELFIPVIGEVHDAHKFLPQVIKRGCRSFFTSKETVEEGWDNCNVILVEDTTAAMQRLAAYYLRKLNLKTVAVTGSVGKTSTRDMVYYILSQKYNTGRTLKNFNSDVGVPLTIFSFDDSMEAAALEVGMDRFGEIHRLVDIIRPDIGIITNIGISHIEHLGSRNGILQAKMEITDFFGKDNILVINQSNDILGEAQYPGEYKVVRAGISPSDEYFIDNIEDYGEKGIGYQLTFEKKSYFIRLNIPGAHNAMNSALAIAACMPLGVSIEQAIEGLSRLELTGNRLKITDAAGIKVINDTYNASPESMKSVISTLINTEGKRKIAILGDMNELGEESAKFHIEVGKLAANKNVDMLIAIGDKAEKIAEGGRETLGEDKVMYFKTKEEFYPVIKGLFKVGDVIAVKASRAAELEEAVERIIKEQE